MPERPGAKDPDPKKNGCPRAILRGTEIIILDQVRFDPNSARISKEDSSEILRAVARVIIDHPEIKKLEVQGHTDNRGDSKANKALSEKRAQAVVQWLVEQGLDKARFTAIGYGDERPIDTNGTEDGAKRTAASSSTPPRSPHGHPCDPGPTAPSAPAPTEKQP